MPTNIRSTFPAAIRGSMHRAPARMDDRWSFPVVSAPPAPRAAAGRVYRRRRFAVVAIVAGFVLLLLVGGYGIAGADSAGPARIGTTAGTSVGLAGGTASGSSALVHVVRPGDTLWSIARAVQPSGDVRPLVERLSQQTGARLDVGMRIQLPG